MKSVLVSIKPKWCELIASGKKTVEVRKTKPKLETPFKVYIYETKSLYKPNGCNHLFKGEGKVIGEFVCDKIDEIRVVDTELMRYVTVNDKADMFISEETCLSVDALYDYLWPQKGYGWHISNLVIYDKPRELSGFSSYTKDNCPANLNGVCLDCKRSDVILCENLDCPHKRITRSPQSWLYVESEVDTE